MSTKFVYHSNGKITRSVINGIPVMSDKGVSTLSTSLDGNYIIQKSGDTYSLTETTAGLSSVAPGNLTNVAINNTNCLLGISADNNFNQIIFSNESLNNAFVYEENKWNLKKVGLFEQYCSKQEDTINNFGLTCINNTKETVIITPSTAETGKYTINIKNIGDNPTLEKISINPSDINYTKVDANEHILYVDSSDNFKSIVIPSGKTWFNSICNKNGTWTFDQMSIYRQCGSSKSITGFGIALIASNTANKIVTLDNDETGQYIISYDSTTKEPTLKKITYISDVNPNTLYNNSPPTNDSLMVVNNNQFKTISNPATSGNVMLKYNSDNTWSYVRVFSPRFTRYALDATKDITLLASGTKNVQDIFTDLVGLQIENNSILHFKIYFYLNDVSLQEDSIGLIKLQRKVSTTETTDLAAHYIYNPVENLIAATFTFPYSGNMSSMQLVTSLLTDVKLIAGIQSELLVETQFRLA